MAEPLLTPEIEALIGRTVAYTAPEPFGPAEFRYFALAIGDTNPIYTDDAAARAAGYDGVTAPPTFVVETNQYMSGETDEHGYGGHSWGIEIPGTRMIPRWPRLRVPPPGRGGRRAHAEWTVVDASERESRAGARLLEIISEARYLNQNGDLLAVNRGEARLPGADMTAPSSRITLAEGTELTPIERLMSSERLVMYAGATWDWHRLHYDTAYAAERNLPAPIVDGQHYGGIFIEQLLAAADPRARVRAQKLRFASMVFVGETVRVTGSVTAVEPDADGPGSLLTVAQELHVGDRLCATSVLTAHVP